MSETSITTLLPVRNYPRQSRVHKKNSLNSYSRISSLYSKFPRAPEDHSSLSSTRRDRTLSLDSKITNMPEDNSIPNEKYFASRKNEEASTAMMSLLLAEAPKEVLEQISVERFKSSTIMAISSILNNDTQSPQISQTSQNNHKDRIHSRKNPYPMRSSQKSSEPASPRLEPKKKQQNIKPPRSKREGGVMKVKQRRRKGNSLARVLADSGIIESPFVQLGSTLEVNGEVKPLRLPLAPQMEFSKLLNELKDLSLDNRGLNIRPVMTWKTGPLSIEHLAHFNELHPTEAYVASILRLTPVQYFNAKHSLITASRRYEGRALPFRKSDAQKILRIDVNKASKLWEFFHQLNWL
ncbi:13636_t:CDS:2 [Ambispora leptoticha]|uniref:13636_t:CDS:1 n=1 Tax=Ambispora leptoticha TaxID=144679 RepID=A0A9N8Z1T7_9GLOM|nr:13636_t:CDS:2 [Ambispora leptoticha]